MTTGYEIVDVDRLDCRLVEHCWNLDEEQEQEVAKIWRERRLITPSLYDGTVLLARGIDIRVDEARRRTLAVEFFEAPFSRLLAWKILEQPDWGVLNCFSTPALRAEDGAFLAGEMGADHSQSGEIYFPCGTPDRGDIDQHHVDLTACLIRELAEETGIQVGEQHLCPAWRIVLSKRQVACLRTVNLPGTAQQLIELVARHIRSQSKPELARMHALRRGDDLSDPRLPDFMKAFLEHAFAE